MRTDSERWTMDHVRRLYGTRWHMRQDANGCWAWRKGEFRETWALTGESYVVKGKTPAELAAAIIAAEAPGTGGCRVYDEEQAPPGRAHNTPGGA